MVAVKRRTRVQRLPDRVLLDTHTLLWMLTDPERIPAPLRAALADRSRRILVSAATALEIATKHRIGKLPHADVLVDGYARHLRDLGAEELDITGEHALLAGALQWDHRDPFDRMLAAQSMVESLPIVSADPAFTGLVGVRVVW